MKFFSKKQRLYGDYRGGHQIWKLTGKQRVDNPGASLADKMAEYKRAEILPKVAGYEPRPAEKLASPRGLEPLFPA